MANKGQKFKKYDIDLKLMILREKQQGSSYKELSEKYNLPIGTIITWMVIFKKNGSLDVTQRGRPTEKEFDYKERYEILKKFQDFLGKKGQKKK